MLDFAQKEPLGNVSRPSNAVLACSAPVQTCISSEKDGTRNAFVKSRCRKCWQCVTSQKNELLGRLLAESAVSQRIELWTLTYNNETPESRVGAKQRCVHHVQKFQKILRQREQRGLTTYNRREKKAAIAENRAPKLVDQKKSYCSFFPVFEFGTNNGRGHFHVVVFWKSHFPVPFAVLGQQEPPVCPDEATRVWDLPNVVGPETVGRPDGAGNPDLIDWRVQKGGSQVHGAWVHGYTNIECLSHDFKAVDWRGRSAPCRHPRESVVKGLAYTLKYLSKPETDYNKRQKVRSAVVAPKMADHEIEKQRAELAHAKGGSRLFRTGSNGLGGEFGRAYGRRLAQSGVPMNHVHFRVTGANVPRSRASLARFEAKISERGLNEHQMLSYLLDAQKMVFQMHKGMLTVAVDEYIEIARSKGIPDTAMGDVPLARIRQTIASEYNERLRSAEYQFRRKTCRELTDFDRLWSTVGHTNLSKTAREMVQLGRIGRRDVLPQKILPPEPFEGYIMTCDPVPTARIFKSKGIERRSEAQKLAATLEAINWVQDHYDRNWSDPYKIQHEKRQASKVRNIGLPHVNSDERYWRKNQDAITQQIFEQTESDNFLAFMEGETAYDDAKIATDMARGRVSDAPFDAWACLEDGIPSELRLRWLNYSDQFDFEKQRERHIKAYCFVHQLSKERRLVITPDGRVLSGALLHCKKRKVFISQKQHRPFEKDRVVYKFVYREVRTKAELRAVLNGSFPSKDGAPLFRSDIRRPFANTWAMRPSSLQSAVISQVTNKKPAEKPFGHWRVKKRIDGYSDAYRQPVEKGPAMLKREQALMKR